MWCLFPVGLLLLGADRTARGNDGDVPPAYEDAQYFREPTEIERYLIIRGQEEGFLRPLQPLDVGPRQPVGELTGPRFAPLLDEYSGVERRLVHASSLEGATARTGASFDPGEALARSTSVQSTNVRRRSPVAQDPYVRGYSIGQIYSVADGVYWTSARADLDSIVNKTDLSLIDRVDVLPGPYGVRYGPGFAFIDVVMTQTPRYECGYEAHNRMGWAFRFNGGQIYGTDTIYGGAERYGYSLTYGHRVGSDYDAGNGLRIPSSYNVGNLMGQVGFDLGEDSRVEFRYQYMNQADTEYAAQFFDINSLVTNAFSLAYTKGQPDDAARLEATGWYHSTSFSGDTLRQSKWLADDDFPVLRRVLAALQQAGYQDFSGFTNGELTSAGARAALILEPVDHVQIRTGADFRLIDQAITEEYTLLPDEGPAESFRTKLPKATLADPGVYAETTLEWSSFWKTSVGGRFDWAYTTARSSDLDDDPLVSGSSLGDDLDRSEPLFSAYVTNGVDLNPNWTTHFGAGYGEVVPDLFQRYANGVFLGMIQSGFSRVIGSPSLPKQRLLQLDVDVEAKYDRFRGRAAYFYGWLCDYTTYAANMIPDPTDARLLYAVSTERASMTGFDLYGEYDWLPWLTPFASARYVRGNDSVINQPLPQIPPLEATVGLRLENIEAAQPWGVECGLRMVDRQHRFASVRAVLVPEVVPVEVATPGFTTAYLRGYYSPRKNLNIIGGIENLFDRAYIEHLDLRLPATGNFVASPVLSPGITPFVAVEWTL
jgi:outer membrane receptor protein involved in Fe transport